MSSQYDRKDFYYQKAKEEGYRSRAAFKLLELDDKYKIIHSAHRVLDLGSWPGGWVQATLQRLPAHGIVVGVDLKELEPFDDPRAQLVVGDVRDDETLALLEEAAGGKFDVIVSDMAPHLTGIPEADQAGCVGVAELALWVAQRMLKPGGTFLCKLFKGGEVEGFVKAARPRFDKVVRCELKSTRKSSNEFYMVGLGFR